MRKLLFMMLFFFYLIPVFALEVSNVIRDFYYPNIFHHKDHLIGEAEANKFVFGSENLTDEERAEFFDVYITSQNYDKGKLLKVEFSYKPANKREFLTISKNVRIQKKKQKVRFLFDTELQRTHGRVELWEVKLFKDDELISSLKPKANRWR